MLPATPASAAPEDVVGELREAGAPRSQLEKLDVVDLPRGAEFHRYQQQINGLPVFGSLVVVSDPAAGAPAFLATDESESELAPQPEPSVSRAEAIDVATKAARASELRGEITAELGIDPSGREAPAWNVLVPSGEPLGDFVVLVDATSGEVLRKDDILQRSIGVQSASARLFRPNPVVENPTRYQGLRDNGDRDSKKLTKLRKPVTLQHLYSGQKCLKGLNVWATLGVNDVCSSAVPLDFSAIKRQSNKFEALMAYYHIDRTANYLNGTDVGAGITPGEEIDYGGGTVIGQQDVRANTSNADNSFYSPSGLQIELGSGGVDDGEDGDVIVHEYGHSIHDDQIPGPGPNGEGSFNTFEGRAMGEGFGDYLSAVMSQRYEEAEGVGISNIDNVCIFDWDGLTYANGCGRRADKTWWYSQAANACGTSFHCFGQMWSSALWALRDPENSGTSQTSAALGSVMDRLVLHSHYLLDQNSGMGDAAIAILQTDETLYPNGSGSGQHEAELVAEFDCRDFIIPDNC